MAGKVTPIDGAIPQPNLREIVSYELSPMFRTTSGERYNPDDLAGRRGLKIYSAMMTDEQVKAVMQFKRDAITSRGWTFSFEHDSNLSDEEKQNRIYVFEKIIERMRGSFEDALNAIAKGRQYGFSMTEIVYDTIECFGKQYIGLNTLKPRDVTTFVFHTDPWGEVEKVVQKIAAAEVEIELAKFIHYVHAPEEDLIYGQSDLRQAYRSWYVKDQIIKLYATFLERFAGGFAVLQLDGSRPVSPDSKEYRKLQSIIENIRNMSGMILPPGLTFDVKMPSTTSEYREALTYFDIAISKSLLVPNLLGLSHAGNTGSFSQSQTQLEAFFWTLNADTRRMEACLQEQLFKKLGDMNWGDGEYPVFRFKPASKEHVSWLVNTWGVLVQNKAVETTADDEAHLRKLLEMPAREIDLEEEGDDAIASDPSSAFSGVQVTAMLDVLARVRDGSIPPETAIEVLVQSYPVSDEDARKMIDPIIKVLQDKENEKPVAEIPQLPIAENSEDDSDSGEEENGSAEEDEPESQLALNLEGKEDSEEENYGDKEKNKPIMMAHTHDGMPRTVSMAAFQRALMRVDFSVMEKKTNSIAEDSAETVAKLVVRSTNRLLGDEARMSELLDDDMTDIEYMKLDGADVGKIKAANKEALLKSWTLGLDNAKRELRKAGKESKTVFADLRDKAAQYFEANGFRMAANISDGIRSIIQQELIQAVKEGLRPDAVKANIFRRLIERGFTTMDALETESVTPSLLADVEEIIDLTKNAAYVDTLIRTNMFEAMNEARFAEFNDPELDGFVEALEYSAILDGNTTEICRELNGKIFKTDSEEWDQYRPPNHYNCRSILIPITTVDNWNGNESNKPSVQPAEGFGKR